MNNKLLLLSLLSIAFTAPQSTQAYAGLGSMAPIIGNGILLLFIFGATLLGLVAYPIKMMLAKMKSSKITKPEDIS